MQVSPLALQGKTETYEFAESIDQIWQILEHKWKKRHLKIGQKYQEGALLSKMGLKLKTVTLITSSYHYKFIYLISRQPFERSRRQEINFCQLELQSWLVALDLTAL